MMLRFFLGIFLSFGIFLTCSAQQYPTKPIKIIVPFPVGGIADIYSRLIGNRWAELWGQPVVIENRTGAGGNIGADMVAKAAPDGYTIGIGSLGTHAVNVSLFSKMPYDPVRDFAPISLLLEAEGACHHRHRALQGRARTADRRRNAARLRSEQLGRLLCARRHAVRHRAPPERGDRQVHALERNRDLPHQRRRALHSDDARAVRRLRQGGNRQVGAGGKGLRRKSGLNFSSCSG